MNRQLSLYQLLTLANGSFSLQCIANDWAKTMTNNYCVIGRVRVGVVQCLFLLCFLPLLQIDFERVKLVEKQQRQQ